MKIKNFKPKFAAIRIGKHCVRRKGKHILSSILCIGVIISMLVNTKGFIPCVDAAGETQYAFSRVADPDTTDDYLNKLISDDNGSRYAGRVWTDKSVFAYGTPISLDNETDGYVGSVTFDSDFGTVFSALQSTQLVNEWPAAPVDLVIAIDMSASMAQSQNYVPGANCAETMEDRIANSRVQATLDSVNRTIDELMEQNINNRASVVVYGAGAAVLLPLAHYKRVDDETPYLSVGGMETLYNLNDLKYEGGKWIWTINRDACYTIVANVMKSEADNPKLTSDWDQYVYTVSNNVKNEKVRANPGYPSWEGLDWKNGNVPFADAAVTSADAGGTNTYSGENPEDADGTSEGSDESSEEPAETPDEPVETLEELDGTSGETDEAPEEPEGTPEEPGGFPGESVEIPGESGEIPEETDGITEETDGTSGEPGDTFAEPGDVPGEPNAAEKKLVELDADEYVGYFTNTQGGIYLAYSQLLENSTTTYSGELSTGEKITVARIPAAIIMTDGGANFAFNEMSDWDKYYGDYRPWPESEVRDGKNGYINEWNASGFKTDSSWDDVTDHQHRPPDNEGTEWYNVYLPGVKEGDEHKITSLYNEGMEKEEGTLTTPPYVSSAGVLYSNDSDYFGTTGTILQVVMTASFMKSAVNKHYAKGWNAAEATMESRKKLSTYTISVDSDKVPQWGRLRLYPSMDPKNYLLSEAMWEDPGLFGNGDASFELYKGGLENARKGISEWNEAADEIYVRISSSGLDTIKMKRLPEQGEKISDVTVTNEDVSDNIVYNDGFYDVSSADMSDRFNQILSEITGQVFVPLSGLNDAGAKDSVTYQDPLGEYMELKNQAITANGSLYDMSLLLFGKMHGLVRAGVYDYKWNKEYLDQHGLSAFEVGWYLGGDPKTAKKADGIVSDGFGGSYPNECASAEDAWAKGWVMRFDFKTLTSFVPIADAPEDENPDNLSEQIKNTVYTCYRLAGTQEERNELHINPIYGESVPENIKKLWRAYFEQHNSYPVTNEIYAGTPGVYRLSDIRVWEENSGDYVDTDGAITPEDEGGYDDSLYVNIPVAAIPTQKAEITLGPNGPTAYETNLNDRQQSTPLRLFYAVGLTEALIERDTEGRQTGVDLSSVSGEYLSAHTTKDNRIWFISNYFSNTNYSGYTDGDSGERTVTRGDAAVSFSPSTLNRYYLFQKPLPLFAHAYQAAADGSLVPVDKGEGDSTGWGSGGSGNGKTNWAKRDWAGGNLLGVYDSAEAFREARTKAEAGGGKEITDNQGNEYPYKENGIVFLKEDMLSNVDSTGNDGAHSFSSDDYFFISIEYYIPVGTDTGTDANGNLITGSRKAEKVTHVVARKGSDFGSGLNSVNIGNGDMLCWADINGRCGLEIEYNSKSDTGDITRGRPTYEKFTRTGAELKSYLAGCGLGGDALDQACAYWENIQKQNPDLAAEISGMNAEEFETSFSWSVATRTGGVRAGTMRQFVQGKQPNTTGTADNYYIPTLSETSASGDGMVINNYLGNNGRLEVANQTLMVSKTLAAPDGVTLTDTQKNEKFNYQVYLAGVSGTRSAQRLTYNPFSGSWQKRVETLDILTDNSSLLLDTGGSRALLCNESGKPRQVVQKMDGDQTKYYYADENGSATNQECAAAEAGNLFYLYLPGSAASDGNTYRLFASSYEGGTEDLSSCGTTAYYPAEMKDALPETHNDRQLLEEADESHPVGTREYWSDEAELVPIEKVQSAEADGGSWTYAGPYTELGQFSFVTVIPDTDGTDSTVYSPFRTRTQYMTLELRFGVNSNADDGSTAAPGSELTDEDLYDSIIPTSDRPAFELSGEDGLREYREHTAEFTLKSGEALLFTGLRDSVNYRFTEKLTERQIKLGYTLKNISHAQQYGSVNTYEPGANKFTDLGKGNSEFVPSVNADGEPFYHTNARLVESYATYNDPDTPREDQDPSLSLTGNHHEPNEPLVAAAGSYRLKAGSANPACVVTNERDDYEHADMKENGLIKHYFVRNGNLIDKHYEGEQDVFNGNRYVVGATAHFLVAGETQDDASIPLNKTTAKTDYTGVYSVFGNTGNYEEQAHFVNTIKAGALTVEKKILGAVLDTDKEFTFTVNLAKGKDAAGSYTLDAANLEVVKVSKTKDGTETRTPLTDIEWKPTTEAGGAVTALQAEFTLKHGEKIVISGILMPTVYTVTEAKEKGYHLQHAADNAEDKPGDSGEYLTLKDNGVSGTITEENPQDYLLFANEKAMFLPFTGGLGWILLYILGALLLILPPLIAEYRKRRRKLCED